MWQQNALFLLHQFVTHFKLRLTLGTFLFTVVRSRAWLFSLLKLIKEVCPLSPAPMSELPLKQIHPHPIRMQNTTALWCLGRHFSEGLNICLRYVTPRWWVFSWEVWKPQAYFIRAGCPTKPWQFVTFHIQWLMRNKHVFNSMKWENRFIKPWFGLVNLFSRVWIPTTASATCFQEPSE